MKDEYKSLNIHLSDGLLVNVSLGMYEHLNGRPIFSVAFHKE